jgi:hypothetical protein
MILLFLKFPGKLKLELVPGRICGQRLEPFQFLKPAPTPLNSLMYFSPFRT